MLRPSPRCLRFFIVFACVALALTFSSPHLAAAQSTPPTHKAPPTPPPPPAVDQQQFVSYWTTETGWRTELQLRNNQVGHILTVTPVLRAVNGTETALFPIVIQAQEVTTVDVATAIGNSAPQLIGAYGSLSLRYRAPSQVNLYAAAMVMGVGHALAFHVDATSEDQAENVGGREGIWWLPKDSANDYLVLTNQGENPLQTALSLFDATGKASTQSITLAPRAMNRYSIRQMIADAKLSGSYGGIKVSATSHAGSLDTLHVVFDPQGGFSAIMKMFDYDPRAQLKERDYAGTGVWTLRAPMLALSNPDPALAFPQGTTLHPQLFIHNTTAKTANLKLLFNWHSDSANGQVPATTLRLAPYETQQIDVASLQSCKVIPGDAHWASVTLTTDGLPDEIVAVAASFDQTLKYGSQTPFSDQLASLWAGGHWEYDPLHDSIVTAGNGGTKPTQAAFTIFYNQGTQKYELDGPDHMVVVSDVLGKCSGCTTAVNRVVSYQIIKFSLNPVFVIPIGEAPSVSGWNCNQTFPGTIYTHCSDGVDTDTNGMFPDQWSMESDAYTPVGCGYDITDHWQWCTAPKTFGTLTGYTHTDAIKINGVVNPPDQFAVGTVIYP